MAYKIDHACFINELWLNSLMNQIAGYPFGNPKRLDFDPIITTVGTPVDRKATLDLPAYTFTDEQKALLLEEEQ